MEIPNNTKKVCCNTTGTSLPELETCHDCDRLSRKKRVGTLHQPGNGTAESQPTDGCHISVSQSILSALSYTSATRYSSFVRIWKRVRAFRNCVSPCGLVSGYHADTSYPGRSLTPFNNNDHLKINDAGFSNTIRFMKRLAVIGEKL